MSRRRSFRKRDLACVLQVTRDAGVEARVEIDPETGKMTVVTMHGRKAEPTTDLDTWIKKHAHSA